MRHVVNAASYLPPVRGIRGSVLEQQPDREMDRLLRQMDQRFDAAVSGAKTLLPAYFQCVEQGLPLPEGLDTDYSGNEVTTNGVY